MCVPNNFPSVGDLRRHLLAGSLLEQAAGTVGDLLSRVARDGVAGLLGAHVEGCIIGSVSQYHSPDFSTDGRNMEWNR